MRVSVDTNAPSSMPPWHSRPSPGPPDLPLPPAVSETNLPMPRPSCGTQKLVCEHLIADRTPRGFNDGRVAPLRRSRHGRLPAHIREPRAGRPATCPIRPELRL
ncbi:hypothetical protein ACQ4WX_47110 [Streptomyces lasalocidi]